MNKLPVLLLTFTKVEPTAKVLEAVAAYQPTRLYIGQDGPRAGNKQDLERVEAVKRITENITWPCEVFTRRLETNVGLKAHVESAITWFFEHEPEGIILEDDTYPNADFFTFCEELIERYRTDKRVFLIGGTNFNYKHGVPTSYFFCEEPIIWGWASWADRWATYDSKMTNIKEAINTSAIKELYEDAYRRETEINKIKQLSAHKINSWATRWGYSVRVQNGLCIIPSKNLVINIGFGKEASNTLDDNHPLSSLQLEDLSFPLIHPTYIIRSALWEEQFFYPGQHAHRYLSYKELALLIYYKIKDRLFTKKK